MSGNPPVGGLAARRARQAAGFIPYIVIPALSAVAPLVAIPTITSRFGSEGFVTVAVGTSVGSAAAVICELGWSVTGPQLVAGAPAENRKAIYRESLASTLLALAVLAPLAAVATLLLGTRGGVVGPLVAVGAAGAALSPAWYLIGVGRPTAILFGETVPRLAAIVVTALALRVGAPFVLYGVVIAVLPIACLVITSAVASLPLRVRELSVTDRWDSIKRQWVVTAGRATSSLYTALPVTLVELVRPEATAGFAAAERVMRMTTVVLNGVPSRLQSWVGRASEDTRRQRTSEALQVSLVVGLLAGGGYAALAPLAASVLFDGKIEIEVGLSLLGGVVIALISVSRGFGLALVAEGRANAISSAIVAASLLGVPSILLGATAVGARGAVVGEIVAEATGIGVQAIQLRRARRSTTTGPQPPRQK